MNLFDALSTGGVGTALAIERAKKQELAQKAETMYGKALELEVQMKKAKQEREADLAAKKEGLDYEYSLRTQFEKDTAKREKPFEEILKEKEAALKMAFDWEIKTEKEKQRLGLGAYRPPFEKTEPDPDETFVKQTFRTKILPDFYSKVESAGKRAEGIAKAKAENLANIAKAANEKKNTGSDYYKVMTAYKSATDTDSKKRLEARAAQLKNYNMKAEAQLAKYNELSNYYDSELSSASSEIEEAKNQLNGFIRANESFIGKMNLAPFTQTMQEPKEDSILSKMINKSEQITEKEDKAFRDNPNEPEITFIKNGKEITKKNPYYKGK